MVYLKLKQNEAAKNMACGQIKEEKVFYSMYFDMQMSSRDMTWNYITVSKIVLQKCCIKGLTLQYSLEQVFPVFLSPWAVWEFLEMMMGPATKWLLWEEDQPENAGRFCKMFWGSMPSILLEQRELHPKGQNSMLSF